METFVAGLVGLLLGCSDGSPVISC